MVVDPEAAGSYYVAGWTWGEYLGENAGSDNDDGEGGRTDGRAGGSAMELETPVFEVNEALHTYIPTWLGFVSLCLISRD